jgi:hypothetical protein
MNEQTSPLGILESAFQRSRLQDWRGAQELCATLGNHPPPIGAVARLNILICQYHLGHAKLVSERALPLLSHLPVTGWLPCAGLALLAARKNGELPILKPVVLALADPKFQPWDLPTVPTCVMLNANMSACMVLESDDVALMSEIVQEFLKSPDLTANEQAKLQSLASRYLDRASRTAADTMERNDVTQPHKPWWKLW